MKNTVFILLIVFKTYNACSQKVISSIEIEKHRPIPANREHLIKIDNEHFVFHKAQGDSQSIVKYNSNLEEVFNIPLKLTNYFAQVKYLENTESILVLHRSKNKKEDYVISGSVHDKNTGLVKKEGSPIHTSDIYSSIKYSSNKEYFMLYDYRKKGKVETGEFLIFKSKELALLGKMTYTFNKGESLKIRKLSNQGNLLLGIVSKKKKSIEFNFYNSQGNLEKSEKKELNLKGEQHYSEYAYHDLGNNEASITISRNSKAIVIGIDTWHIDFNNNSAIKNYSTDFDKELVKGMLYNKVFKSISNKNKSNSDIFKPHPEKGVKALKLFSLSKTIFHEGENMIAFFERNTIRVSDGRATLNIYNSGDLLIVSFDSSGKVLWSNVIDKSTTNLSGREYGNLAYDNLNYNRSGYGAGGVQNIYRPKWTGIRSSFADLNDEIEIITQEAPKDFKKAHTVTRKFNKKTGKMTFAKYLISEGGISMNTNYMCWFNKNMISLLNITSFYSMSADKRRVKLQVLEIKE